MHKVGFRSLLSAVETYTPKLQNLGDGSSLRSNDSKRSLDEVVFGNDIMAYSVDYTPGYLKQSNIRKKAAHTQQLRSDILYKGKPVLKELLQEERRQRAVSLWTVEKPDYNAWRKINPDNRSLYSLKEEAFINNDNFAGPGIETSAETGVKDKQTLQEKTYIASVCKSRNSNRLEQKRFSKALLSKYCTPKRLDLPSYGAPKDAFCWSSFMEDSDPDDEAPEININTQKYCPVSSTHANITQSAHCDTLGASSCHNCIEGTNKKIAKELEYSSFPQVDCSVTTLVAPSLAMLMIKNSNNTTMKSSSDQRSLLFSRESDVTLPLKRASGRGSRRCNSRPFSRTASKNTNLKTCWSSSVSINRISPSTSKSSVEMTRLLSSKSENASHCEGTIEKWSKKAITRSQESFTNMQPHETKGKRSKTKSP